MFKKIHIVQLKGEKYKIIILENSNCSYFSSMQELRGSNSFYVDACTTPWCQSKSWNRSRQKRWSVWKFFVQQFNKHVHSPQVINKYQLLFSIFNFQRQRFRLRTFKRTSNEQHDAFFTSPALWPFRRRFRRIADFRSRRRRHTFLTFTFTDGQTLTQ